MSISVNTLLTTSTIDSDSNWITSAHIAVVLTIKLRSLPSPNVFEKMASAVRIELTQSDLESNSPNPWNIGGYTKMVAYAGAAPATPEWKSGDLAGCRIGH